MCEGWPISHFGPVCLAAGAHVFSHERKSIRAVLSWLGSLSESVAFEPHLHGCPDLHWGALQPKVFDCVVKINMAKGRDQSDSRYGPPDHVFLTGGGCQVPEVLQGVR
jgi:hypothetical protein